MRENIETTNVISNRNETELAATKDGSIAVSIRVEALFIVVSIDWDHTKSQIDGLD